MVDVMEKEMVRLLDDEGSEEYDSDNVIVSVGVAEAVPRVCVTDREQEPDTSSEDVVENVPL